MTEQEAIPFNDLSRSLARIRPQINEAVARVMDSGWFVMGPEHDMLEAELAEFVGVKHAVNVANGTDALELALAAVGVKPNGTVLTVANAGAYTSTATLLLGAEPVFVDVDQATHLMSADTLEATLKELTEAPQAIVVTHLYGAVAPMYELLNVANRFGIPIVEDCAQSLGAKSGGSQSGSFGHISTTSFYPTKNLGALGDGGAVFTNSDDLARKVRSMRQYGWSTKYNIENWHGKNSRLDEIQAAILRVRLKDLSSANESRLKHHAKFELATTNKAKWVNSHLGNFNAHLAVLVTENRNKTRSKLRDSGIPTEIHYPKPDHRQNFAGFVPRPMSLPVTEWAADHVLSVPMFPELTKLEVDRIASAVADL